MNTTKLIHQLKHGHHRARKSSAAIMPGGDLVVVVKDVAKAAHAAKHKHKHKAKKKRSKKRHTKKRSKKARRHK